MAASLASILFAALLLVVLSFVSGGRAAPDAAAVAAGVAPVPAAHRPAASPRSPDDRRAPRPAEPGSVSRSGCEDLRPPLRRRPGPRRADLTLRPGELVALLGPSGCGKTTALRILAGLEEPTVGRVVVGGRDLTTVPANKRDMGMVFQAYSLFPHLTARANVEFGLELRRSTGAAARPGRWRCSSSSGSATQADRYASQLSGGQQQRVALARALAIQPSVLLLDEPLSALDAKVRAQLRDEIRRVQLEVGTTTLFVTHDQEEALAMADRVGVMTPAGWSSWTPRRCSTPHPRSAFVADFVGLMNRVPAEVADGHAACWAPGCRLVDGSVTAGRGVALIRPEQLALVPGEAGASRVVAVSFQGPVSRARVRTAEGTELVVLLAGPAAAGLAEGSPVDVRVDAAGLLVAAP